MRQKTIRVFEVDDYDNLIKVVESKYELIKNHYFLLREPNKKIEEFLKSKKLPYFIINSDGFTPKKEITEEIKVIEKEIVKKIKSKTLIYDKIIRSGEEIKSEDNLIFLNRINAGAKIISSGNIEIFDECEGRVECDGDYIIVKKNIKGSIIFKGADIGQIEKLTLITENMKKVLE
ncbi:septum site-determining protein MinC [Nautilia lithotrophica]